MTKDGELTGFTSTTSFGRQQMLSFARCTEWTVCLVLSEPSLLVSMTLSQCLLKLLCILVTMVYFEFYYLECLSTLDWELVLGTTIPLIYFKESKVP